jgi:hypothetical protein
MEAIEELQVYHTTKGNDAQALADSLLLKFLRQDVEPVLAAWLLKLWQLSREARRLSFIPL